MFILVEDLILTVTDLILTNVLAIIATVVSFYNLTLNRKKTYNETVTTERIKWLNDVRELTKNFIEAYLSDGKNKHELVMIKSCLFLLLHPVNKDHKLFMDTLDDYLNNENLPIDDILLKSQTVLRNNWETMKTEAGLTKYEAKDIRKRLY
jgi:hypothetical protein